MASLRRVGTTHLHDLASRLIRAKCKAAAKRPPATLLQLVTAFVFEPRHKAAVYYSSNVYN
jgi:hypothetical protein